MAWIADENEPLAPCQTFNIKQDTESISIYSNADLDCAVAEANEVSSMMLTVTFDALASTREIADKVRNGVLRIPLIAANLAG